MRKNRQVMVFVFTFAVGGGSGNVISMPNWALVSFLFWYLFFAVIWFFISIYRIRLEIQIIVKDSRNLCILIGIVALFTIWLITPESPCCQTSKPKTIYPFLYQFWLAHVDRGYSSKLELKTLKLSYVLYSMLWTYSKRFFEFESEWCNQAELEAQWKSDRIRTNNI